MLTLTDREAVAAALNDPDLNPCLRTLLAIRAAELFFGDHTASLHVVQGGDSCEVIEEALGFAIGEGAPDPGYQWIEGHGRWFEIAITTGTGLSVRIFVEDSPATELSLHAFCLGQFWPDCGGGR